MKISIIYAWESILKVLMLRVKKIEKRMIFNKDFKLSKAQDVSFANSFKHCH